MVATSGMGWRLAPSLEALVEQADRRWPDRNRKSDGSIGDTSHAARDSDHNPADDPNDGTGIGWVCAVDLTDDDDHGPDSTKLVAHLVATKDRRVKLTIHAGRIWRAYDRPGLKAWTPEPYTGPNAHRHHVHVSIWNTTLARNDLRPWFPPVDGDSTFADPLEDFLVAAFDRLDVQKALCRQLFRTYLDRNPNDQPELDLHVLAMAQQGYEARVEAFADSDEGRAVLTKQRALLGV